MNIGKMNMICGCNDIQNLMMLEIYQQYAKAKYYFTD